MAIAERELVIQSPFTTTLEVDFLSRYKAQKLDVEQHLKELAQTERAYNQIVVERHELPYEVNHLIQRVSDLDPYDKIYIKQHYPFDSLERNLVCVPHESRDFDSIDIGWELDEDKNELGNPSCLRLRYNYNDHTNNPYYWLDQTVFTHEYSEILGENRRIKIMNARLNRQNKESMERVIPVIADWIELDNKPYRRVIFGELVPFIRERT